MDASDPPAQQQARAVVEAQEVRRRASRPRVPGIGLGLALTVFVAVGLVCQAVLAMAAIGWPGPGWWASLGA